MKKRTGNVALKFIAPLFLSTAVLVSVNDTANAQDIWQGGGADNNWMTPGNWQSGSIPSSYDSLTFSGANVANYNNFANGAAFGGITFASGASAFTLSGDSILLSGSYNGNTNGVLNNSGMLQSVNLYLNNDWGVYTFTSSSGTLALNGGLTNNPGGVAYLDTSVSFPNLAADPVTGLIPGLQGGGLIYSGGMPTGLATISGGGNVTAYSGYTSFASGAISSGNNIYLSAGNPTAGSTSYTAPAGTTVNTITVAQTGNTGGSAKTTLTVTGTLTLGANGGVYLLDGSAGSKSSLNLTGGELTAGPTNVGGTIVFAVNGTVPSIQATIASAIDDNGSGKVSVVSTGTGFLNPSSTTCTFSGGLYVDQGVWQGNATSIGKGNVYVASDATMVLNASGTYNNNFYISPGPGSSLYQGNSTNNPGAILGSPSAAANTYSGQFTLLGAPLTWPAPGCRITGNNGNTAGSDTYSLSGHVTGTGTLDFNVDNVSTVFLLANSTGNANDWQGGLILEASYAGASVSPALTNLLKLTGTTGSQIPSSGNLTLASVVSAPAYVILDMLNKSLTINGLNSYYDPGNAALTTAQEQSYNQYFLITNSGGVAGGVLTLGAGPSNTVSTSFTYGGVLADGALFGNISQPNRAISLVKTGVGTQIFNGPVTISGGTTINGGTMALASANASIPNTTNIDIVSPGTFDVTGLSGGQLTLNSNQTVSGNGTFNGNAIFGAGSTLAVGSPGGTYTLAMTGSLTLNSGSTNSVIVNKTVAGAATDPSDEVDGLISVTLGGTLVITNIGPDPLVAGDAIPLFGATSYSGSFDGGIVPSTPGPGLGWDTSTLLTDGTLRVVATVNTNPTNIVFSVSGGTQLTLSWPSDHTGWRLLAQTNSLGVGIGTNWVNVSGSSSTDQITVPIDPTHNVFYELVYP